MFHFGDPCIHCGCPHDDVPKGPCKGDPNKAIPIAYRRVGAQYDGTAHYRIRFSDGRIEDRYTHVSFNAPYYHFGNFDELIQPPRYDPYL
jgi:hypothetical protein